MANEEAAERAAGKVRGPAAGREANAPVAVAADRSSRAVSRRVARVAPGEEEAAAAGEAGARAAEEGTLEARKADLASGLNASRDTVHAAESERQRHEPLALLVGIRHGEASRGLNSRERLVARKTQQPQNSSSNQRRADDAHSAVNGDASSGDEVRLNRPEEIGCGGIGRWDLPVRYRKRAEPEPCGFTGGEFCLESQLHDLAEREQGDDDVDAGP